MAKAKPKKELVYSYHVNVYEDEVEVTFHNWSNAVPGKIQRTFDAVMNQWHHLRRTELHEIRKKQHAQSAEKDSKQEPTLPEGAVPSRKEVENV